MWLTDLAKSNRKSLFLALWMAIIPLTISSLMTFYGLKYEYFFQNFHTADWIGFFMMSSFLMGFAFTPTTFMALFTGYFLSWWAAPGMIIGYTLASLIGFQLTSFLDQGTFLATVRDLPGKAGKNLDLLFEGLRANQYGIIILARISPVLPFAIMNVVLPMAGIRLKPFLWAGTIGMMPRTLFFIWIGSQAQTIRNVVNNSGHMEINNIITTILIMLTFAGGIYYARKIFKQQVKASENRRNEYPPQDK